MKICTFNVLNLFLNMDKYRGEDLNQMTEKEWDGLSNAYGNSVKNKSLFELIGLAQSIKDIDADAFILPEVGGYISLKNFNEYFLDSKYQVIVKEENSPRGIFVGFLIKKEYQYHIQSFSKEKILVGEESRFLSRNLNFITLSKDNQTICHLLGIHLKSQMNLGAGKDVDYMDVREAELKKVVEVYQRMQDIHPEPIFVAGDFNCDLMISDRQEANALVGSDLIDIHSLKGSSDLERTTFVFFQTMPSVVVKQQLDFIFFNKKFASLIDLSKSGTYYFKNEYGDSLGIPTSLFEKQQMPSDHLPLIIELITK